MSDLMGGGVSGVAVTVTVDGAPLDPMLSGTLIEVEVETHLAIPDEITLVFSDPDDTAIELGGFVIGSLISVEADLTSSAVGEPWILSMGQITGLEVRLDHYGRLTVVHGLDMSHQMMRGRQTMAYPMMDYSEIAAALAAEAGLVPVVEPTGIINMVTSQASQTNWDFLQQLARESNRLCYVRQGTLYFTMPGTPPIPTGLLSPVPPPPTSMTPLMPGQLLFGSNLSRISSTIRASEQVGTVIVPGVDLEEPDVPFIGVAPPNTEVMENLVQPIEVGTLVEADDAMFVYADVPFDQESAVESAAESFAERIGSAYTEIDGEAVGCGWLTAGINVAIGGTGLTFDGIYMVTSARHIIKDTYRTEFTVSGTRDVTFAGLANSEWQQTKRHLIHGVVTGIVTSVMDPEDPMAPKCQLMFPWLSEEYLSPYARVCAPGGGFLPPGGGNIWMPQVGQEVLVAFDRGDIRAPYVLGGLYNAVNEVVPVPEAGGELITPPGLVNQQIYKSQTGHTLVFGDSPEMPMIMLQTADTMLSMMFMMEEGSIIIQAGEPGAGASITLMATGEISIMGGNITITGQEGLSAMAPDITVAGEASVTMTGADVTVEGDATVAVSAPAITIGP